MGKKEMRKRLAALSPTEKIKVLEKLRDRSLALAGRWPEDQNKVEEPQRLEAH